MYSILLSLHSIVRWLVLLSLLISVVVSVKGLLSGSSFRKSDNTLRHWTATIAHIQLMIGIILYTQSPVVRSLLNAGNQEGEPNFFGFIHSGLMLLAIVLITVGSAKAKREDADRKKFSVMLIWFLLALIVIFAAIPWPFSPLSNRPYFRFF